MMHRAMTVSAGSCLSGDIFLLCLLCVDQVVSEADMHFGHLISLSEVPIFSAYMNILNNIHIEVFRQSELQV